MLLRVSGDKSSLGKIIDVNFDFCLQLKYEKSDLVGSHIRKMLPGTIADCHDDWMLTSYDTLQFSRLGKLTYGFVRDKDGYFQLATMIIKEIPHLKDGLSFLAAMQINKRLSRYVTTTEVAQNKTPCVLLCERNGRIIGINEEATKAFHVTPMNIERDSELSIETILPILGNKGNCKLS